MTSAIVSAIAAASARMKNQIFVRNTASSLLPGRRVRTRWNLWVELGLALGGDLDRVVGTLDPAVRVPDLHLVAARRDVRDLEPAALVGVCVVERVDHHDLRLEVRRVLVTDRVGGLAVARAE